MGKPSLPISVLYPSRSSDCFHVLWQWADSACQFERDQKSFMSRRCGLIWSTTSEGRPHPQAQIGWTAKKALDSFAHLVEYPRSRALGRIALFAGVCLIVDQSQAPFGVIACDEDLCAIFPPGFEAELSTGM